MGEKETILTAPPIFCSENDKVLGKMQGTTDDLNK